MALLLPAFLLGFTFARLDGDFSLHNVKEAARVLGLPFSGPQLEQMMPHLRIHGQSTGALRSYGLENAVPPAMVFNPLPRGFEMPPKDGGSMWQIPDDVALPSNRDELAFYSIPQLASLLRQRLITSEELTLFFLDRLERYADTLECVVNLTHERALEQARHADQLFDAGKVLGPLQGIPYGAKDLFAVQGYPTTWGAMPFRDQQIDYTATVIRRLDEAGAVLVAKTTLGALAMGDIWYGGQTRNPWDLQQGSSGSSAGSGAAVAAGLLPFALGTETLGSIVSPSTRNGVTGLRPSFGLVSRDGAMALSWSMDKVGPMARSAEECAMVLDAIHGPDGLDQSLIHAGFAYRPGTDLSTLKVGYIASFFGDDHVGDDPDHQVLADLRAMGIIAGPVEWNFELPVNALRVILYAEAAAAFDELTISGRDSLLVNQGMNAWPNLFRAARFIPAVEYINAQRVRQQLIAQVHRLMSDYDVIVTPSFGGNQLLVTNLTGHPCLVAPSGFDQASRPVSISFIGNLFEEEKLVALAQAWQDYSMHNKQRPEFFDPSLNNNGK